MKRTYVIALKLVRFEYVYSQVIQCFPSNKPTFWFYQMLFLTYYNHLVTLKNNAWNFLASFLYSLCLILHYLSISNKFFRIHLRIIMPMLSTPQTVERNKWTTPEKRERLQENENDSKTQTKRGSTRQNTEWQGISSTKNKARRNWWFF